MGVASLVLGIVALIFSFIPFMGTLSVIIGIVGIILGALGTKNPASKGLATAGLVMSIIAVALGLLFWIACFGCGGCAACMSTY